MLARIQGFFIVVNTLLVPTVVLATIGLATVYGERFAAEWEKTRQPLVAIAQNAEQSAEKVRDVAQRTEAEVRNAMAKIETVGTTLQAVGDSVAKPLDAIAAFSVPTYKVLMQPLMIDVPGPIKPFSAGNYRPEFVPGSLDIGRALTAPFRPIVTALTAIAGPMDDLRNAVQELEKLKALQPQLAAFQAHVATVAEQVLALAAAIVRVAGWVVWFLVALSVWFAIGYVFWAITRLKRGLALLAGRSGYP